MPRRSPRKVPRTTLYGRHGAFDGAHQGADRICDADGCDLDGTHRAPVSPSDLETYRWFCLEHVREYNKAWNYCAGRSNEEIESLIREDTVGWRPTWPMGGFGGFARVQFDRFRDRFGLFEDDTPDDKKERHRRADGSEISGNPQSAVDAALDILDLSPPVTADIVKAQYIILVKRHHPDANGGDKVAEERLKLINQAYATLKETLTA